MRCNKQASLLLLVAAIVCVALMALVPLACGAQTGAHASSPTSSDVTTPPTTEHLTAARARALHANEMGEIPVLMYHLIGHTKSKYNRTPQEFRQDMVDLKAGGYYPVNVRDLASGSIDVPAGKSPVAITFDDSSEGQYRILADGSLDPDCAVGIMQAATEAGGWAARASFFPLIDVTPPDHDIFGQPALKQEKLRNLVAWGYEVGSHTVTHLDLSKASVNEAKKQLAQSAATLKQMIGGGYQVTSLAVPFGDYPSDESYLAHGTYQGQTYTYTAGLKAVGGPSASPFSATFKPLHIDRIEVSGDSLASVLSHLAKYPELRYFSDGDKDTISIPERLPAELGTIRTGLTQTAVRY